MSKKNDIFYILSKIDEMDTTAYGEFEKEFSPYMCMKWMAGIRDPKKILYVNTLLNSVVFSLSKEKKLLYYLACCTSNGTKNRYNWIKRPKKPNKDLIDVVMKFYDMSYNEARDSLKLISKNDIIDMAKQMGYTDKEVKSLKSKNI
jgi:hypothetical protein